MHTRLDPDSPRAGWQRKTACIIATDIMMSISSGINSITATSQQFHHNDGGADVGWGSCQAIVESCVAFGRHGGDVGRGSCQATFESVVACGWRGGDVGWGIRVEVADDHDEHDDDVDGDGDSNSVVDVDACACFVCWQRGGDVGGEAAGPNVNHVLRLGGGAGASDGGRLAHATFTILHVKDNCGTAKIAGIRNRCRLNHAFEMWCIAFAATSQWTLVHEHLGGFL